eukprot:8788707-Lingulodinium_polyedra.AAC.1
MECSPWVLGAEEDVLQAPLPAGPKRLRRISPALKEGVAAAAAKGEAGGKTSQKVWAAMARFRVKKKHLKAETARNWDVARVS